nr:hypothetical protein B0A51_02138 [Rachicladosporium sp. CCFEE 5018]
MAPLMALAPPATMPQLSHDRTQAHSPRQYNDATVDWQPWHTYIIIAITGSVLSLIIHTIIYTRRRRARSARQATGCHCYDSMNTWACCASTPECHCDSELRHLSDALSGQPRVWRSGDKIGQKKGPGFEPAYRVDDLGGLQPSHVKTGTGKSVVVEQPARAYSPAPPGYDESVGAGGRRGAPKMTPARAKYLIRQEELAAERDWAR